jgi:hypothetical protein
VFKASGWLLVVGILCVGGFIASLVIAGLSNAYKAYGEVPIPGSARLHLPAGDVVVSIHTEVLEPEGEPVIPQNLELVITAPSGAPEPSVTDQLGDDIYTGTSDAHRQVKVAHIPVAGDYTITTNGRDSASVSPRLSFGHDSPFGFVAWPIAGLGVVSLVAGLITWRLGVRRKLAGGPAVSSADLLASGQRVRGVLKSFASAESTARSRDVQLNQPELLDAPYYALQVELRMPNLAPVVGRNRQQVPLTEVPKLAIGRELDCAVDPADPATRFVVDWKYRLH